jgi:hypothetical protein
MAPDNLARFARLSQQAKLRETQQREAEQAELKAEWAKQRAEALERGRARREQLEAEGPPNGCRVCYTICESWPWTGEFWDWHHGEDVNPQMRPLIFFWEDAEDPGEVVPVCTHECHGPDGHWTPIVVYA